MKTRTLLLTAGAAGAAVLMGWIAWRPSAPLGPAVVKAEPEARRSASDRDDLVALSLRQGAAVGEQLATLEARLKDLEAAQARGEAARAPTKQESPADPAAGDAKPKRLSEGDLAAWMRHELRTHVYDPNRTREAGQQIEQSLRALPGVELDDTECAARFCRCTLSRADGERPDIDALFGAPPFVNQAFTIHEDDGTLSIFFTPPGVSIDELKSEARAARGT